MSSSQSTDSMISAYNANNNDFEFSSPVFYLPPVMPLRTESSVYAPFEVDEQTGAVYFPAREFAADYSYDNLNWQSQPEVSNYSSDEYPMSPTDSMTTTTSSSSSSEEDTMSAEGSHESLMAISHSCFSSIAGFAQKGYF